VEMIGKTINFPATATPPVGVDAPQYKTEYYAGGNK